MPDTYQNYSQKMPKWARKSQNAQIFLNLLLAVSLSIQVFDRVCLFMKKQFVLVEEKRKTKHKIFATTNY
jgi:hypothetical protein